MGVTGSIILFVCIWWIVFFSLLPVGIQSQNIKFSENLHGNDPGAPKNPKIGKKFFITTLITTIIFLVIYYVTTEGYLNLSEYLQ